MKTLAVLSALATIAIAAPALENYTDSTRLSPGDFVIKQQRDKKSTPVETHTLPEHVDEHISEQTLDKIGSSSLDARTFSGLKKPIIVKKKIGYHVYRNSEEEQSQADSQENRRKEKKAKLCEDSNSMDEVKSVDHHHEEITGREIEDSINKAREAVHTFERDLHKFNHDCAVNNKNRKTSIGSDTQLHQDIEVARQALEHIHRKFKNFDSINTNADQSTSKIQLKIPKSDEERMIQWKEAGNFKKNVEIAKNLEDNFKSIDDTDESKHTKLNHFNAKSFSDANKEFKTTVEDIDVASRSNTKFGDDMTSIVQDKDQRMEIHSDSLIKGDIVNEADEQRGEKMTQMEHQTTEHKELLAKNVDNHEMRNHNKEGLETKERSHQGKDNKSKFEDLKGNDLNILEKQSRNHFDNSEMLKSSGDDSTSNNHEQSIHDKESLPGHLNLKSVQENDQAMHESSHVIDMVSNDHLKTNIRSEGAELTHNGVNFQNDKNIVHLNHDNFEQRTTVPKHIESISDNQEHLRNNDNKKNNLQQMEVHNLKNEEDFNKDTQRSLSTSTNTKLDNEKDIEKTHFKNNLDNHVTDELPHLRATSDFHKELLNNMDFVEDSHQMALHQASLTDNGHTMKDGKPELHERLNIPHIHSNSDHLKTMMHFSDSSHIGPHQKMSSMFNHQEPNFNVQFNAPQDFIQQTNVQELMPFRATVDANDKTEMDKRLKSMHDKDEMQTELHDPLKVHRPSSDHMRMDGSSQHFSIEKLTPLRANSINDQHLSLNEQIRAQQRWAQAKNHAHHLSAANTGFEHLHGHDSFPSRNGHNMMLHEKSNLDVQPNSFAQMRGAPKMALEYTNSNQWANNQGAFRSSYGPPMPAYGSGGGSSSSYGSGGGSSSSGSAVGVFPNANVGNCAVPILLSCSPSVVSGSLAKTQNAYSAPAYRSEDVNFHKKRGVDIDAAPPGLTVHHTALGHRPHVILEKNNNTV